MSSNGKMNKNKMSFNLSDLHVDLRDNIGCQINVCVSCKIDDRKLTLALPNKLFRSMSDLEEVLFRYVGHDAPEFSKILWKEYARVMRSRVLSDDQAKMRFSLIVDIIAFLPTGKDFSELSTAKVIDEDGGWIYFSWDMIMNRLRASPILFTAEQVLQILQRLDAQHVKFKYNGQIRRAIRMPIKVLVEWRRRGIAFEVNKPLPEQAEEQEESHAEHDNQ